MMEIHRKTKEANGFINLKKKNYLSTAKEIKLTVNGLYPTEQNTITMEKLNWSEFTTKISINASKETIFSYWSSQENLEKWFLSMANFYSNNHKIKGRKERISKGDTYKWMWYGSDNIDGGEILGTNDIDFLKFTFLRCVVSINIREEDGENIIELTQSQIALDESSRMDYYVGCTSGWTFYLTNLKSILEGGIDLRNRNKNLKDVINT